ncbi:GPI inositol-deacylase [Streptomyces beigongshangae]|uniref:GPI inositol-deacylase n=1 Tax=Streptomyces beigongshangae TaxID=2841597 RepID=UPI001C85672E|nr:GPI inositol-deacylase [Streptomyces sp. REN17]
MELAADAVSVLYVHGAGNKPPADALKRAWDQDLFGRSMGGRTRMVHYADLLHGRPGVITADACGADGALAALVSDALSGGVPPGGPVAGETAGASGGSGAAPETGAGEPFGAMTAEQQAFALSLTISMAARAASPGAPTAPAVAGSGAGASAVATELLPLPGPLRRFLLRQLLERFVPDANRYFFTAARETVRNRMRTALDAVDGPVVVIGHSLGTVIAYDVLSERRFAGRSVPLFVTLGSPLGYTEIQDVVVRPLRIPPPVRLWMNFADRFDLVTLDTTLAGDFRAAARMIADIPVDNRSPNNHASCGYLRAGRVRSAVTAAV